MEKQKRLKKPLLFTLAVLPMAALAGLLVGMYTFAYFTEDMRRLILAQAGSYGAYLILTTVQSTAYGAVCSFLGYILSEKVGLMRPLGFTKAPFLRCSAVTVVCGILFACDYFVFAPILPEVAAEYAKGISGAYFFASLLYGGVMEEIMMRLFLMSLLSLLIWKLAARKCSRETIPTWVFITANLLSAGLFAAGHLPATVSLFGELSPMIVFRCLLLNGALGLVFGRFYRKYGIQYAMLGHFGCHFVSKLLLILL